MQFPTEHGQREEAWAAWLSAVRKAALAVVFPLALFYFELLFKFATGAAAAGPSLALLLLFCAGYGGVCWLLATLPRSQRVRRWLTPVFLVLLAVPYLVQYFVFQAFRVLYDLNTILAGAQDAVGGFGGDIWALLTSPDGLLYLFLFLLPALLALFWAVRGEALPAADTARRLDMTLFASVSYLAALLMVLAVPSYRAIYQQNYSYGAAVDSFGLLTGMGLDCQAILGGRELAFTNVAPAAQPTVQARPGAPVQVQAATPETAPAEPEPTPVVYDYNAMDIDFEALAAGADGTLAELDRYAAGLTPSRQNEYTGLFKGKNLIFISAEAFCAEVIDPERTPTLYRLANKGIRFTDYYQPASAGTTGGECANLLGVLPMEGGMSVKMTADYDLYFTMGSQLDRLGYYGMAYHNNDYTYYDRDKTHVNLGYSGGYMGYGNGMEEYVTAQWPQSDLEMIAGTLPTYIDKQPFNIYYMSVSGHSPYTREENAMAAKHWDEVADLPYSEPVRCYLAANLELEDALTYLVDALEEAGIADDTVICLSPDHFPYGLDFNSALGELTNLSELYGENVTNYLQRDHSCLIIWSGCLEDSEPITVDAPTFSPDILPTLSNLFGTEFDSRLLPGRDVFSDAEALVFNTGYDWKTELGICIDGVFSPNDPAAELPEGYIERINATVRNKLNYCRGVLDVDYFGHVFGPR